MVIKIVTARRARPAAQKAPCVATLATCGKQARVGGETYDLGQMLAGWFYFENELLVERHVGASGRALVGYVGDDGEDFTSVTRGRTSRVRRDYEHVRAIARALRARFAEEAAEARASIAREASVDAREGLLATSGDA